jgi:hypothetical protein
MVDFLPGKSRCAAVEFHVETSGTGGASARGAFEPRRPLTVLPDPAQSDRNFDRGRDLRNAMPSTIRNKDAAGTVL